MTSDLRERVARAMYERWQSTRLSAPSFDNLFSSSRESELADADAAIAIVLEEAATRAEREKFTSDTLTPSGEAHNRACDIIAAAIRALASSR